MHLSFDRILGIIGVLGIVIGVGVAIAMDPKSRQEMQFSVGCFIVSGLALSLTVGIWGFKTELATTTRICVVAPLFALVCVSMVEASRWAVHRYDRSLARELQKESPHDAAREATAALPKGSPEPTAKKSNPDALNALARELVEIRKDIAANSQPQPIVPPTRLGIGPEAYKDISDVQVGQWAMEEATKIENLARNAARPTPGGVVNHGAEQWIFKNNFNDCCAQDAKDLRAEILRRLGPPAKDTDEMSAWGMLFTKTIWPEAQENITPYQVSFYAPYLRKLGLQLKRKHVPRFAPKNLSFTEVNVAPDSLNFPYNILVTIKAEGTVSAGYVLVEFDSQPGRIGCDLAGSRAIVGLDVQRLDDDQIKYYTEGLEHPFYLIAIGPKPLIAEKPLHVIASTGGPKPIPFHATKVTLFDE